MQSSAATAQVPMLPDLSMIRESKGISLEDISRSTKIGKRYLEAIERSAFGQLPGGVFNTNYIRQYARAIDYDEWDLVACYEASTRPPQPQLADTPEQGIPKFFRFAEPLLRLLAPAKKL
jgi:cytoskeletal protein RodZ